MRRKNAVKTNGEAFFRVCFFNGSTNETEHEEGRTARRPRMIDSSNKWLWIIIEQMGFCHYLLFRLPFPSLHSALTHEANRSYLVRWQSLERKFICSRLHSGLASSAFLSFPFFSPLHWQCDNRREQRSRLAAFNNLKSLRRRLLKPPPAIGCLSCERETNKTKRGKRGLAWAFLNCSRWFLC